MEESKPVDLPRLISRLQHHYAPAFQVPAATLSAMLNMLQSQTVTALLALPQATWSRADISDLYKPRMHLMYAQYLTGVTAEFALGLRRSALSLDELSNQAPHVASLLWKAVDALKGFNPYVDPHIQDVLRRFAGCEVTQELLFASAEGFAGVHQDRTADGHAVAVASGPVVSASLVETTLMQLLQSALVMAQASILESQHPGLVLDRTERLANSLCKLCLVAAALNASPHNTRISLFAGRRSSDKLFLVLQNLFFAQHVRGYVGTSSIFAVSLLDQVLAQQNVSPTERVARIGRLIGTHAHEQTSILQQLLAAAACSDPQHWSQRCTAVSRSDDTQHHAYSSAGGDGKATSDGVHPSSSPGAQADVSSTACNGSIHLAHDRGDADSPTVSSPCLASLLAHLLFLAANDGLDSATALSDTFGTAGFLAVAAGADVPGSFRKDILRLSGKEIHPKAKCIDLFKTWRIDSGRYEDIAELVMSAWEQRCVAAEEDSCPPPPRPILMHSNLSSVEEVLQVTSLPERIRPSLLAFGTLADGFLPFSVPDASNYVHNSRHDTLGSDTTRTASARHGNHGSGLSTHLPNVSHAADNSVPCTRGNGNAETRSSHTDATSSNGSGVSSDSAQQHVQIQLASMVMKAVQARAVKLGKPQQASAVKLGDDASLSKATLDPRLSLVVQTQTREQLRALASADKALLVNDDPDKSCSVSENLSGVLARVYDAVTRKGVLSSN